MSTTGWRFLLSILFGLALGILGAGGVAIHDGGSLSSVFMTGAALFAVGFGVVFFRVLRRIAELLSALH